uniref:Uncharacterized protein n=1 Tax=Dunaliella tertiolecta TaxID=3047 RepID=A0A7S3QLI4_DUNTE
MQIHDKIVSMLAPVILLTCSGVMTPRLVMSNMPNIVRRSASVSNGCVPETFTSSRYLTMNFLGLSGLWNSSWAVSTSKSWPSLWVSMYLLAFSLGSILLCSVHRSRSLSTLYVVTLYVVISDKRSSTI